MASSFMCAIVSGLCVGAAGNYLWKSWRFPTIPINEEIPNVKVLQLNPKLIRAIIDFKNKNLNDNIYNINFPVIEREFITDRKMKMTNGTYLIDYEVKEGQTLGDFLIALHKGPAKVQYFTVNSMNPFAKPKIVKTEVDLV